MRFIRTFLIIMVIGIGSVAMSVAIKDISANSSDNLIIIENETIDSPMGVATDGKYLYAANSNQHNILVFDLKGKPIKKIGQEGISPGQFKYPVDIAVSPNGKLYIADLENHRIQVLSKDGEYDSYFPKKKEIKPVAVTFDKEGNIVISDILSHTIKVYKQNGELIKEFGTYGEAEGSFKYANGVAVSDNGYFYVSDSQNMRLQVFNREGEFLKSFNADMQMGQPKGISIYNNELYVTDTLLQKILVFDLEGDYLKSIGEKGNLFNFPNDVFVTRERIFVANRTSNQVISMKKEEGL